MNKKSGNIILIGFMGSGKTTFGRWISDNYDKDFLDTDETIEKKYNTSIKNIFSTKGEAVFRDMETETIKELIGNINDSVISVGGGLPVREENRKLLKELGVVIYLDTSKEELIERLKSDDSRPLLLGGDLKEKIERLINARESLYLDAADIILKTDGMSFENMYSMIEKEM